MRAVASKTISCSKCTADQFVSAARALLGEQEVAAIPAPEDLKHALVNASGELSLLCRRG